jgi:hypothetical protein
MMRTILIALLALFAVAAHAQSLTPTSTDRTTLTTADGTWSFSLSIGPSGNVILLNGSNANGGQGVLLVVSAGKIYAQILDGRWWIYSNVSGWSPSASPDGEAAMSCTAPTTNTDGSTIAGAQLPLAFYFYEGIAHGPMYRQISPAQTTCSYVWKNLEPGPHYFAAIAVDALGASSGGSNEATKAINVPTPNAPTGLTAPLQVLHNDIAYQIVQAPNQVTLLAFGNVPAGTVCDPNQSMGDAAHGTMYLVPYTSVTMPNGTPNTTRKSVFAPCG